MSPTSTRAAVLVAAALLVAGCSTTSGDGPPSATTTPVTTSASAPAGTLVNTPATTPVALSPSSLPAVSARARAAGLRDVRTVVPDAVIDLRYATTKNFTKVRLYPRTARCLVHTSMLTGLAAAGRAARKAGLRLVFWDCYRPHSVQVRMFRVVSNPDWVARPGPYARSHEAGRSVDVTLARGTRYLDMGTGFDNFTARATAFATKGVSSRAERNRALLRTIMRAGRFTVYAGEWWHFDGRGAGRNRPHLNAPVY